MHTPLNLYTKGRKGVQSVSKQVFSFDIECREDSKFMPRGKSHCFVLFFAEGFFLDKDGDFVIISLFPEGVASAFRRAASRHTG